MTRESPNPYHSITSKPLLEYQKAQNPLPRESYFLRLTLTLSLQRRFDSKRYTYIHTYYIDDIACKPKQQTLIADSHMAMPIPPHLPSESLDPLPPRFSQEEESVS